MSKLRDITIDVSQLLGTVNLLIFSLTLYSFFLVGENPYLDRVSIFLALGLCVQTHFFLKIDKLRKNPLFLLLSYYVIFYYSLRIVTLTFFPFSTVLNRFHYAPENSNYAMLFIIIANFLIYAGFYFASIATSNFVKSKNIVRSGLKSYLIWIFLVVSLYTTFFTNYCGADLLILFERLSSIFSLFLNFKVIIFMSLIYFYIYRNTLEKVEFLLIPFLLVLYIMISIFFGSRSAIFELIELMMLIFLALGNYKVKFYEILLAVIFIPLLLAFLFFSYTTASKIRQYSATNTCNEIPSPKNVTSSTTFSNSENVTSSTTFSNSENVTIPEKIFPNLHKLDFTTGVITNTKNYHDIFTRVGYFDFSAGIITNTKNYQDIFTFQYYLKSIVDNLLTPGFDVFDVPKSGNALHFIYDDIGVPSKKLVSHRLGYQSDQFGIYGEFYAFLGWWSLIAFFVWSYLFSLLYARFINNNLMFNKGPYTHYLYRAVCLHFFIRSFNNFGHDWELIMIIPYFMVAFIYSFIIDTNLKRVLIVK